MKIRAISASDAKNIPNSLIENVKIFKPYNRNYQICFDKKYASIEFEMNTKKSIDIDSLDSFLYELGYVLPGEIINNKHLHALFEKAYHLILNDEIEIAPPVNYAFNEGYDVLARAVLQKKPHANSFEFRDIAFDLYKELGLTKADFSIAVQMYAN